MPRIAAHERPQLVETRRRQILDAALQLMAKKSFDATSVEEIARAANVSKGSVYLYFPSKRAIADELVRRYTLLPAIENLKTVLASVPLEQGVRTLLPILWLRLKSQRDAIALMVREGAGALDNSKLFVENVVLPANQIVAEWLEKQLGPKRASEIDTFVAARALLGMVLVFFMTQELFGGSEIRPIDSDAITSTVAEVFLHGVLGSGGPS
jgi:AcrR family transcriptional regulator